MAVVAWALGRYAFRRRFHLTRRCSRPFSFGQRRGFQLGKGVYGVHDQSVTISKQRYQELLVAEATQMAQVRQTSVSIELMRKFGTNPTLDTLLKSARFLYKELPVRYAIRAKEFELAPSWIKTQPFKQISDMYMQCFLDLRSAQEPNSARAEEKLCEVLSSHKERLALVISLLAEGATELKSKRGLTPGEEEYLQDILDRFLTARIGTSVLTSQHLALHEDVVDGRRNGYVGALQLDCSPDRVFRDAAESVRLMCQRELGQAPGFVVKGHLDVKFPYFPAHIHYIGCELLKNSFRATIEHSVQFRGEPNFSIPNVEIVIGASSEDEDVCIMIRDRGGGIPSSAQKDVWRYTHTTWDSPGEEETHYTRRDGILAGKGFGLPLSRLYARFFGGDLELCSLAGIGTAAYVRLKRLGGVEQVGNYHQDRLHAAFPQTFTPRYPFERD
uniref:Protein-serine/threonine kinase n=1 Tax=Lotharella globosa TaxID=91324 RepID=A0A6V3P697_9EUKA|mmetsp:Transcript_27252/g.52853  ORF Transcript_27252/g.52853 Transcript_27252/m.52853 type:complete len:444 (-) Transcript_27252:246-1577(-)